METIISLTTEQLWNVKSLDMDIKPLEVRLSTIHDSYNSSTTISPKSVDSVFFSWSEGHVSNNENNNDYESNNDCQYNDISPPNSDHYTSDDYNTY